VSIVPEENFETFFVDEFPRLVGFLISLGYGSALAQDCAADAMYRAHEIWCTISHPRAYVRKVATQKAARQVLRDLDGVRRAAAGGWLPPAVSPDPTHVVDARMIREQLLKALPDRQREVMAWTFDGFTPAEIAEALEIPAETVRSHLRHARQKLKTLWKQLTQHEGGA
jgi:RNA polymerase sigma-70 factor (ECF subfamily)